MKYVDVTCLLRKYFCFFLLITISSRISAQLTANFTAPVQQGCGPLLINFTDASAGGATQWLWNLGNGATSTEQNPQAIYINPGKYTVSLTIKNASQQQATITKSAFITVFPNPTAIFTASPLQGCAPLNVSFLDKSLPGAGNITGYIWDFGDGTTATDENPVHTYNNSGTFTVSLNVTNNFGCNQIAQNKNYIKIGGLVKAGFTYNYTNVCKPPATVSFKNTSVSNGALSYQWYFGDGSSGFDVNPVHTFAASGNFEVKLVAKNAEGCINVFVDTISIGSAKADFNFTSACTNEPIVFTDASSPQPLTETWNFGDGTTGIGSTASHIYKTDGPFTVTLTANFGACTDVIKKTIMPGQKPKAAFTVSGNSSTCIYPVTLKFNNTSEGAKNYRWLFGDGTMSDIDEPNHTYAAAGKYSVTLIAFNVNGCPDTLIKQDIVQLGPPKILSIKDIPFKGCAPKTETFRPVIFAPDPIKSYLWDFGDSTTSTDSVPKHTYTKVGSYTIKLKISTASGCSDSIILFNAVQLGKKPNAAFTADPLKSCAGNPIQFTDNSTGLITDWHWFFGDGGTSSDKNPLYEYNDTGYRKVTLIVSEYGCSDTLIRDNYVFLKPPVARFIYSNQCADPFLFNFTDSSIEPKTWKWTFGDGETSTDVNPAHTYAKTGIYTVSLTTTNGNCSYTRIDSVNVVKENPDFSFNTKKDFCKYDSVRLFATKYQPENISAFYWDFNDGNTAGFGSDLDTVFHAYKKAGKYNPYLIVQDIHGCIDTIPNRNLNLNIYGPTAAFSNTGGSCVSTDITFTDKSVTDGVHAIKKWIWDYGDSSNQTLTAPPFNHIYTKTGAYTIVLKVFDSNGCYDSIINQNAIEITKPIAGFSVDSLSCSGNALQFSDSSNGVSIAYKWNFGDGGSSVNSMPNHTYTTEGIYNVQLIVTDKYHCVDTLSKPALVKVIDPKASFNIADTAFRCPPANILPQNTSSNYTALTWVFGDGNTSQETNPTHYYTNVGSYNLQLIAQGYGNCYDTISKKILLKGPEGKFSYGPLTGCNPLSISFAAKSKNTVQYVWDYGNGVTETSNDSVKQYQYETPGQFLPKLIIVDSGGCQVPLLNADTILVYGAAAKYSALPISNSCDSVLIDFKDSSFAYNDNIVSYQWDFGDGNASANKTPDHYYNQSKTYNSILDIKTARGCESSFQLPVNIAIETTPQIKAIFPDSACLNSSFTFNALLQNNANTPINWAWNLGNGDTSSQQSFNYTYSAAKNYNVSVIVKTPGGCADTAKNTVVVSGLPIIDAGADSTICLGNTTVLKPSGGILYLWQSSTGLSCVDCAEPVAKPDFTTMYFVSGKNKAGCVATDSVKVEVKRPAKVLLIAPDSLCVGSVVHLSASGEEIYNWLPANLVSNLTGNQTTSTPQQTTIYTVIGSDSKRCFNDTASSTVHVFPYPTIRVPDSVITLIGGNSYVINTQSSEDVNSWEWNPPNGLSCMNCPQPTATPKATTTYTVTAKNIAGCTVEKSVTITVLCKNENLFIPNTFSPNNDGMNDHFYPRGKGFSIKTFRIFSRWGNVVYEKTSFLPNDQSAGWDGKYKGNALQPDVYVYVMEILCDNGNILSSKGNVTLLR